MFEAIQREGVVRGRAEGKAEGKIESKLTVLELRFDALPATVQKKIRNMRDTGRIDKTLKRAVDCENLKGFPKAL